MAYNTFSVTIGSDETLLMHNGQTADPLNPYAKQIKAISGKRKKVDADYEAMALLEYEAGLYLNAAKEVYMPGRVLEACIVEGAKKSKEGKLALSGVFVGDARFTYAGGPLTVEQLKARIDEFGLSVGVRVGQARVMRMRPMFKGWEAHFEVEVMEAAAQAEQLKRWLTDAGTYVGLGDWRPRYGRFELRAFAPEKKAGLRRRLIEA